VWGDVLDVGEVGADDDFFALGGHSLLATRVVSRLTSHTGADVPLHVVFQHPVLGDLARQLADPASWPAAPTRIQRLRRVRRGPAAG
ncbi:non-ribosomal peptide synthetase-like protein, partial [Streptomyces zinciresistens K42]